MLRTLFRAGWKVSAAVVLMLVLLPAGRADAAPGACGYVEVQLGGAPVTVPLVTLCTPAECTGLTAGPVGTELGGVGAEVYLCVRL